jgi:molybdopterin molybdotransferase
LVLKIVGTCLPGRPFPTPVVTGQTVRIMTGAPLPTGADAVLPVENTETDTTNPHAPDLLALEEVSPGKHVGQVGEDLRAGERAVAAGRQLRPQDVGLLSSLGCSRVPVVCRPRIAILTTGNELLPAGSPPTGYRIPDANGPMLAALTERDGGETLRSDIIADDPAAIRAAFETPAEIILVSGGSSVGQEDFAPKMVAEMGELAVHGVAMRPSSPTGLGRLPGKLVFLLPGNPVSCLCAYDFFAGRAIRAYGGLPRQWPYRAIRARLSRKLVSTVGRLDYCRVSVAANEAEPLAISGASILSSTTRADGFIVVPQDSEGYPAGTEVEVFLYQ